MSKSCNCSALPAAGDPQSSITAGPAPRKKRAFNGPRYGNGSYCVFSKSGKKVRCYKERATATKVAGSFGSGFTVRSDD